VLIEEKVDGSQFSFGKFGETIRVRSHNQEFPIDAPPSLFKPCVETVLHLAPFLRDGWTYRGEAICKPKHNTLAYGRTPAGFVILFDINDDHESYLPHAAKEVEAARLGLEVVPVLHYGPLVGPEQIRAFLDRESVLGVQKIEGVVVKDYAHFCEDGKAAMGKFVSEAFKERHSKSWDAANPKSGDIVAALADAVRVEARWTKAIQGMRDDGTLTTSPKDIGALIKSVQRDVDAECEAECKAKLWEWARPHILRGAIRGLPEWYKARLLDGQFGGG
jgi:hypothetical protein